MTEYSYLVDHCQKCYCGLAGLWRTVGDRSLRTGRHGEMHAYGCMLLSSRETVGISFRPACELTQLKYHFCDRESGILSIQLHVLRQWPRPCCHRSQ